MRTGRSRSEAWTIPGQCLDDPGAIRTPQAARIAPYSATPYLVALYPVAPYPINPYPITPYPHPTAGGVVGTVVHSYDPTRPYQSQIPAMRPPQEAPSHSSPTPIYDALYSEYRRSFRALPGDRSGEEDLGFTAFGMGMGTSHGHGGHHGYPHTPQQTSYPQHLSTWQNLHTQHNQGRQHGGNHLPAALPPGPRRGF